MFTQYQQSSTPVNGVKINYRIGGKGPALLLLHGHPQTHVIWHKVADTLAKHFTVVAADLRGYGDSDKPPASANHHAYSKRVMAQDQVELMQQLGFDTFSILAHDRGARVAFRLAMDHPNAVSRMILLDIAPTLAMYEQTTEAFARAYWHWFFLIRPEPLPETLITANPENYLRSVMSGRSNNMEIFSAEALAEYLRCIKLPETATGICEDYRASATIDLEHDQCDIDSGKKLDCPLLILWGQNGIIDECFSPLSEWEKVANNISGNAVPSGHYIPEEVPDILLDQVFTFLNITRK